mmetsp:Transcript_18706/g.27728  ORF Transcript_18706/g.27728 Transcript_18706/m.27728 type:complete len:94 (-) Transcript_18706:50-331(-)
MVVLDLLIRARKYKYILHFLTSWSMISPQKEVRIVLSMGILAGACFCWKIAKKSRCVTRTIRYNASIIPFDNIPTLIVANNGIKHIQPASFIV